MSDDDRARATTAPRLAVLITATLLGGMIAAVGVIGTNAIEPPLTEAAQAALRDAGLSSVSVSFEGREAFLTADGASAAQLADAERVVEALDGVRWATVVERDPATQPFFAVEESSDGVIAVSGTVGTAAQASAIQDAAVASFGPDTVATVTVDEGVALAPWADDVPQLFAALVQVDELSFTLAGEGATLTGAAADPAAVQTAAEEALGGIPLAVSLVQSGPTPDEAAAINTTVVRFIADSVTLDETARGQVAGLADALRRFPQVGVTLTGHIAIPVGTEDDAVAFSRQRAQAVADALIADGIASERIEIVGAGSSQPVGDNATADGAAANRRVTVLIMEGD